MCSEGRLKYIAHQLALLYQALVSAKLPLDEARTSIEVIPAALFFRYSLILCFTRVPLAVAFRQFQTSR
jgi:hypothetical protein